MVHVKATSKKSKNFILRYENATAKSIYDCYSNPSRNKRIAEMQCRATMVDTNGRDFRIMSYNTMQFTCGWKTVAGKLRVETAQNSYLIY